MIGGKLYVKETEVPTPLPHLVPYKIAFVYVELLKVATEAVTEFWLGVAMMKAPDHCQQRNQNKKPHSFSRSGASVVLDACLHFSRLAHYY